MCISQGPSQEYTLLRKTLKNPERDSYSPHDTPRHVFVLQPQTPKGARSSVALPATEESEWKGLL